MSELRTDRISSVSGEISFAGITTFSGTGAVELPVGTEEQKLPPKAGHLRITQGDISSAMEYYDGQKWITV